jgi:hypothetical protein
MGGNKPKKCSPIGKSTSEVYSIIEYVYLVSIEDPLVFVRFKLLIAVGVLNDRFYLLLMIRQVTHSIRVCHESRPC